jgi:hypothetical protein
MLRPTCGGEGEKYYQLIASCYLSGINTHKKSTPPQKEKRAFFF